MRDNPLDILVIGVGCGVGPGEHITCVEDVEPLVLHRPHVEVADRDDVEHVEIVFEPEHLLVPAHRLLQQLHRMVAFVFVAAAHPDAERHVLAGLRRKAVPDRYEVARDQREQVGRLWVRIDPSGPMPAIRQITGAGRVAVRKQHRKPRLVGTHRHGIARHDVGAVGEIGDAAEPLGFALRAEIAAGGIEPVERGVALRRDSRLDLQRKPRRQTRHHQPAIRPMLIFSRIERPAVDRDFQQFEFIAVEM